MSVWRRDDSSLAGPAVVEGDDALVKSQVVPGFELSIAAIFE